MTHHSASHSDQNGGEPVVLSPKAASHRVLIVEDEKRLREMLHASVIEMGLHPTAASSGENALKLMDQHFFAMAVVDLNLPGIDGLELCERMHRHKPHIQVVILTGFGDLDAARKAIRLEAVDFLTKPCGMDDLENALNRARLRWLDRWASEPTPDLPMGEAAVSTAIHQTPILTDPTTQQSMEDMERTMILASLARHSGNRQAAAADLGISVRKLYYRLQQYQRLGHIRSE